MVVFVAIQIISKSSLFPVVLLISPGNMKFSGVLPFTPLENVRRAMSCDPEKCSLSMFKTLNSLLNVTLCCWNSPSMSR